MSGLTIEEDLGKQIICLTQYEIHNPIILDGDNHFELMASREEWSGAGTLRNPYLIEGYNITDSAGDLFSIRHTTVHFIIQNCYLDGLSTAWGGIVLNNVINGKLENNIVLNINTLGIGVYFSENITIANNEVENSTLNSIRIEACPGPVRITNNIINSSADAGIWVGDSSYNTTIIDNNIFENRVGILFGRDTEQYQGIFFSVISQNLIYDNEEYGIEIGFSSNNIVSNNVIADSPRYGVLVLFLCYNTEVIENNFYDNNEEGISQARDDGQNSTFQSNFWNDHTAPDSNHDGIVDLPYAIDGLARNVDSFPLTEPTNSPLKPLIPPNIISGGIILLFIFGVLAFFLKKNRK
ncbi:MAG: right-handed parallel beta-helix repeat-containing protein [Promethearchaeota archaeon]